MTGAYYDIEIFSNYVSVLALDMTTDQGLVDMYVEADISDDIEGKKYALGHINYKQFIFHEDRWDAKEFFKFFDEIKLLVGFNSIKFDDKHEYKKINWHILAKKYSGIEFSNYKKLYSLNKKELNTLSLWYDGIDVSSGCIWNKNALISIRLIQEDCK